MSAPHEPSPRLALFQALLEPASPPALGPGPRPEARPVQELEPQLQNGLKASGWPADQEALIRSLVLLWHDHLEDSHVLSQKIESADGSYVHGIMHRREPDYSNAKYWFRRVGNHPCFGDLGREAEALLKERGREDLAGRLLPRGTWDPFAMVDWCERLEGREEKDAEAALAREIQAREFGILLRHICR